LKYHHPAAKQDTQHPNQDIKTATPIAAATAKSDTAGDAAPLPPPPPGLEVLDVVGGAVVDDEPPSGPGVVVGEPDDPDWSEDEVETGDSVLETPLGSDELVESLAGTILPPNTLLGADALAERPALVL